MDIIIRNGVIQEKESKEIDEIKNKAGSLKKNFDDYITNSNGPYYDLKNCHICIPRKHYQIKNFIGPQNPYIIKLIEISDFNKKASYCSICHREMKSNLSFSKKKMFVDDDYFEKRKKPKPDLDLKNVENCLDNMKISSNNDDNIDNVHQLTELFKSDVFISTDNDNYLDKQKHDKIIKRFYYIVYKLIKSPILYNISFSETKLIWPWELTNYQKLRLENPNYKLTHSFYSHQEHDRISEKYVIIE